jgi:hypothetical protein
MLFKSSGYARGSGYEDPPNACRSQSEMKVYFCGTSDPFSVFGSKASRFQNFINVHSKSTGDEGSASEEEYRSETSICPMNTSCSPSRLPDQLAVAWSIACAHSEVINVYEETAYSTEQRLLVVEGLRGASRGGSVLRLHYYRRDVYLFLPPNQLIALPSLQNSNGQLLLLIIDYRHHALDSIAVVVIFTKQTVFRVNKTNAVNRTVVLGSFPLLTFQ